MSSIKFDITGNNKGLLNSLNQAQKAFGETARIAEQEGGEIEKVFDKIRQSAMTAMAGFGAKEFAQKIVQVRGEFQQLEIAFTTMLRSEEKANELMNQLVRTAAITPFDLKGVAEGAKQLMAYGTAAEDVNEVLTRLGDIAAGMALPLQDLVYLYGTTMVQGGMFTQDLRQFQGRGIPIAEEIAKIFGTTKDAVADLVREGKVTDEVFKQAIENMTNEGSKFGGLMEAQSKTITGQISNIEDALDMMFNDLGKKSEGVINDVLGGVSYLVEHYEEVGKTILTVVAAYGAYKGALLAIIAAQKLAAMWGSVEAFFSLAKGIRSAKDAMLLFNMAVKANPLGLLLSVVSALAAGFYLFSSSEGKAAEMTTKFGESAVNSINKVQTLTTALNGLTVGTSTHNKVMEELNDILQDYGIEAIKEGDSIDSVNEKREKAIELIKQEGVERQRLNNLEMGANSYQESIKSARDTLYEDLQGASTWDDLGFDTWANDEIRDNAEAITTIIAQLVEENISLIAGKTGDEYEAGLKKMYEIIQERMRRIGISEKTIQKEWVENAMFSGHDNIIQKFLDSVKDAKDEYTRFCAAINTSAQSDAEAIEKPMEKAREAADFSQTETETLISKIASLKKSCDELDREIDIKIRIGAHIDFNGEDLLDKTDLANATEEMNRRIREATNDEAVDNLLSQMKKGRGKADYGSEERKLYDRYIAQLEATKRKNNPTSTKSTKKNDAAQLRRQEEEYQRLLKQTEQERVRAARDLELSTAQATIDAMEEGSQKTIAQIQLDFQKQEEELRRGYEDLRQKKIDEARQLWEANPANKGKSFDERTVDTSYTDAEQENYRAQLAANQAEYNRRMEEQRQTQLQYLYDYIKEYGSIQAQKEAIAKEYATKIAKEQDEIQKAALAKERDRLLADMDMSQLQNSIDWESVFDNLDRMSTEALRSLKAKLRAALDMKDITPENAQILVEKILEIEDKISERTNVWSSLIPALRERERLTRAAAEAQEEYNRQLQKQQEAQANVASVQLDIIEQIRQAVSESISVDLDLQSVLPESQSEIMELYGIDEASDAGQALAQAFARLQTATVDLTKANEEASKAQGKQSRAQELLSGSSSIGDIFKAAVKDGGGGAMGIISLVNDNAQSLADFVDKIGVENTDFGQAVHGFADGVNGFQSAISSLAKGDIVGAVNGVLDGIAGFGKMGINAIIGGGNEEEMEKEIARLSEVNENLSKSIDSLSQRISDSTSTNKESVEAYKKALEAEKEWEANQRSKIDARASEYANSGYGFLGLGGKHSFNANAQGSGWAGWAEFNNILKEHGYSSVVNSAGSMWNLTPEELELLRDFAPTRWQELFNTDGHRNPQDLVNEYIERSGKLDELTSVLNEKLTGYSWDGFMDSYKNLLKDLDSTTEDFADHIQELITTALIESFVNETLKDDIKALYDYITEAATDGIDEAEQARINSMNEAIANKGLQWRESMQEAGMIKASSNPYEQKASSGGWQSMGQDTADELNGRFTALQMSGERISANTEIMASAITALQSSFQSVGFDRVLSEINNLFILHHSTVCTIDERMEKYYQIWDRRFANIEKYVKQYV